MGRKKAGQLARLIEQVSRGERRLADIKDPELREAVRLALRLHREAPLGPDAARRARMRRRVMGSLKPRGPSIADRLVAMFTVLAKPAPYAMRALALLLVCASVAATATVASADALPDDTLYGVRLAAEQIRLALATTPEDRALVELSIAQHRLVEAQALAVLGDVDGALVASSAYSASLANAAADLAAIETLRPETRSLVSQLSDELTAQRARALATAALLASDPRGVAAAQVLAAVAASPTGASGPTRAVRIAQQAAAIADGIANVADGRLAPGRSEPLGPSASADSPIAFTSASQRARAAATPTTAATARPTQGQAERPSATPTGAFHQAQSAAAAARRAAHEAHQAAERALRAAQKTRTPDPTPER